MIVLDRVGNAAIWLENQLRPPKPQPQLVPATITVLTGPATSRPSRADRTLKRRRYRTEMRKSV
jgi:hypothetical protein